MQCGQDFVFRAAEQKYWYETRKFYFGSVPIRCLDCRRRRRSENALCEQISRAKAQVRASAADPAAHLALAQAIVKYHERVERGDLNEAALAARRAAAGWPENSEPLLWEGIAHARAGRKSRARKCLEAFLSRDGRNSTTLAQ